MKPITVLAVGALTALAVTGCRDTAPTFAPAAPGWPAGYGATQLEPGLWAPGNRAVECRWQVWTDAPYPVDSDTLAPGSTDTVALAEGVKFASSNCGGWHLVSPWQGVS